MEQKNWKTDNQLVSEFMTGNEQAFDELLKRYQEKLYSYLQFTVRNDDMADDLFQETFVKAIVQIRQGKYVHNGKFGAWLTRIAHNLLIDVFRNEKVENYVYEDEAENAWTESAISMDGSRENELSNEQVLNDVRNMMGHLPQNQREVVYMRFYQDMSFKEIAETTGVSINTSLGRMRYAILNLRKMAAEHHISLAMH